MLLTTSCPVRPQGRRQRRAHRPAGRLGGRRRSRSPQGAGRPGQGVQRPFRAECRVADGPGRGHRARPVAPQRAGGGDCPVHRPEREYAGLAI